MGTRDQARPPLPARLTSAERDFYTQLRRLVDAAGLSCRALQESTLAVRSDSEGPYFFSKSQWARWLNGKSSPPRKAVRKLAERLAEEELAAGHLIDLWDKAFTNADTAPDGESVQIRPRQIPASVQQFAGRTGQLAALTAMAHDVISGTGRAVIVIEGMAGVGKTTLANHFAASISDRFPDGQLYVNMRGYDHGAEPLSCGEVLPGFLTALGVAPNSFPVSVDDQAGLYRSVLAGKRVLIVIDNARDAEQVRQLLPGGPACLVLVTSRNQLPGLLADGARLLRLDPFTSGEARDLLSGRIGLSRVQREPQAAGELIGMCGGLPLALSVAAAYAATHPDFSLAALVAEFRSRGLDLLDTGDPATTARTVFSRSYEDLCDRAARVFRLLALPPGPDISLPAVASLTALPVEETRKALDELTRAHLVEEPRPGRFSFHELLRTYAAEEAERRDPPDERRAAAHRVLDHYLHSAMSAAVRFTALLPLLEAAPPRPGVVPVDVGDEEQAAAWFDTEAPMLLALVGFADASGFDEHAWLIPRMLSAYLRHRGRHQDWVFVELVAVAAARRREDAWAQAHSHYQLGWALSSIGDNEAAEPNVRQALQLFREFEDRASEAIALNELANMLEEQGRYPEALAVALDGLEMVSEMRHWWRQGTLENTVGWLYAHVGEYDLALVHCQQALDLHKGSGNQDGVGSTLDSIGYIYRQLGDLAKSRAYYERAIAVHQESGALVGEARALTGLGDTLAASGDVAAAQETWAVAEAILGRLSHPKAAEVRAKLAALNGNHSLL